MEITLDLRLPRDAASVPITRQMLDANLRVLGVEESIREDIQLMLTEACGNVIRHAEHTDDYTVRALIVDDCCLIKVMDTGQGFDVEDARQTVEDAQIAEHGRGLEIMRTLADDVRFTCMPHNGALVALQKHLKYGSDTAGDLLTPKH